jgi:hypothetical protein
MGLTGVDIWNGSPSGPDSPAGLVGIKDSLESVDSRELKGGWGVERGNLAPLSLFHNLGFALDESEFEP